MGGCSAVSSVDIAPRPLQVDVSRPTSLVGRQGAIKVMVVVTCPVVPIKVKVRDTTFAPFQVAIGLSTKRVDVVESYVTHFSAHN